MTKEELREWFFSRLNNCYPVLHDDYPDSILWYYDEKYIRKTKLCILNNKEVVLPSKVSGECLYLQKTTKGYLYCDYDRIWSVFYDDYSDNYDDVQELIRLWLEEESKMNLYTSFSVLNKSNEELKDELKMKVYYTPRLYNKLMLSLFEYGSKINVYTPAGLLLKYSNEFGDESKMRVYNL